MKKAMFVSLIAAVTSVAMGDVSLPNTSTIADIQKAINDAQPGEVITLADGTYAFDAPLTIEKAITLTGSHRDKCILQGSGQIASISAMKIADADACVKNLTITKVDSSVGDYQYHGIAVWITAGLLTQARVTECKTSNGNRVAGVSLEGESAVMTHCMIDHNTSSGGNGVGGVRIHKSGGTMANCLVWGNTGGSGDYGCGGVSVKPDAWKHIKVVNCTIVGNTATKVGGGLRVEVDYFDSKDPTKDGPWIVNTIIADNTAPSGSDIAFNKDDSKNYTGYNCLCPSVTYGANPQTADPLFVNAEEGDFHLQPSSKARNKGDTAKAAEVLGLESLEGMLDYYGVDRVLEDVIDIGCSEFVVDPDQPTCVIAIDKDTVVSGDDVTLSAVLDGFGDADDITYSWTIQLASEAPIVSQETAVVLSAVEFGSYTVNLTVSSKKVGKSAVATEFSFLVLPKTIYVTSKENPGSAVPYGTKETAATSLIDALSLAVEGATVILDEGTHNVSESVVVKKGVTIRGAGRDLTTLYATKEFDPVVQINGEGALVQGLTVAHGRVKNWWQQSGSGVVIGSDGGTLADCRVTDCGGSVSRIFGAVNISGSGALVTRCLVDGNSSLGSGSVCGGIFATGGRIENCVITNNVSPMSAYINQYYGSGLCLAGEVTVLNCTITGNQMTEGNTGAGVHVMNSKAHVHNCIIDGNLSGDGTEANYYPANGASFSYCLSSSEAPAGSKGCIVGRPVFDATSPLYLAKDSPGRSKGSVVGYEDRLSDATDFFGLPRVKNVKKGVADIDIGATESKYSRPGLLLLLR